MNSFTLKLIACITMLIDHIFAIFVPYSSSVYMLGRGIGRIAFPIYCFLLVEGFYHTSSRKKYLLRMFLFALLSEIPFDLAFYGFPRTARLLDGQNVMLTLFIGLLLMNVYEYLKMSYLNQPLVFNTAGVIAIVAASALATFLATDYSYMGILFILVFYLFWQKKLWIAVGLAVVIVLFSNQIELAALVALLPIFTYNGKEGRKVKYVFYAFYPVHLLILGLIKYMM